MLKRSLYALVLAVALVGSAIAGDPRPSQPITLYRGSIESGNAVVSFVRYDDPNGTWARNACEDLRRYWESKEFQKYFCEPLIWEEWVPRIEWRVAK
jgi:hypothetical protein